MPKEKDSPFAKKSTLIPRSPSRVLRSTTRAQSLEDLTTHKQKTKPTGKLDTPSAQITNQETEQTNKNNTTTKSTQIGNIKPNSEATNSTESGTHIIQKTVEAAKLTPEKPIPEGPQEQTSSTNTRKDEPTPITPLPDKNDSIQKPIVEQTTKTPTKMNRREIQQNFVSCIPEFNGEEPHLTDNLTRFLDASDSAYNELTNEEKIIFNNLIKFRLTGNAYIRISKRETPNYPTLKKILNDMYTVTLSLEELEKAYTNIQQEYGETIRGYGHRLIETIDQYKNGYKIKYNLNEIDQTYKTHLETAAVQIFKRGLNNTILRDKVATIRAKSINEIIEETDTIEKMLAMSANTPSTNTHQTIRTNAQPNQIQTQNALLKTHIKPNQVICNYCQRPNHTWDICRTRMAANAHRNLRYEYTQNRERPQFNSTYNQNNNRQNRPQQNYFTERTMNNYTNQNNAQQNNRNFTTYRTQQPNFTTYRPQTNQNNHQNKYTPPQQTNYTNYRETANTNFQTDRPPKYCSHCKVTIGHTFEECRNKFRGTKNYNTRNYNQPPQPTNTNDIEQQMNKMRINTIHPDSQHTYHRQNRNDLEQGNATGSDQQ